MQWLNDPIHPKAAALALQVLQAEGTDVAPEVIASVGDLKETPVDTALILIRDQANKALASIPVTLGMQIREGRKDRGPATLTYRPMKKMGVVWFWGSLINSLERPPKYIRKCPQCGTIFTPQRSTAIYCSETCRAAANR